MTKLTKAQRARFADIGEHMVEAITDTNRLREMEPYPQPEWREAWNRRSDLLAQFIDAATEAGRQALSADQGEG